MESTLRRTWAEIDLDALAHNYRTLRDRVGPEVKFLGVVKADAYGHGAVQVSRTLQTLGADYLAVSSIDEATELRCNGITMPILGAVAFTLFADSRIGSAGGIGDDVKVRDVVIAMGASTNSHFADQYRFPGQLCATADFGLLRTAVEEAERMGVRADVGQVFTADQFYNDNPEAGEMYRKFGILALEMEAAGLYWTAQRLGKKALAILTISDHIFTGEALNAQERQDSFHEMMEIALETAWKSLED